MKILAVLNPISGGINKVPFVDHFKAQMNKFGIEYELFETTGKNDHLHLKQKISRFHPDKLVSIGGDGTTIFTACSLIDTGIPFGIIPMGSANGMATELAIDQDPKIALSDFMQSDMTCPLDLIRVNDNHYCIHIGDVGVNANIVEEFAREESRGMTSYIKHFLDKIINSELLEFQIVADGKTYFGSGYMIAIANSRKYGTGVVLNYEGDPTDGRFEIVVLRELNTKVLIKAGLSRFNNELAKGENIMILPCKEAKVTLNKPHTLQLDGEIIDKVSEFEAKIVESAVCVITTKNNPFFVQ